LSPSKRAEREFHRCPLLRFTQCAQLDKGCFPRGSAVAEKIADQSNHSVAGLLACADVEE
jgi:hypothetical protein